MRKMLSYIAFAMIAVLAVAFSSCDDEAEVLLPTITSFDPESGPVGTAVTITGTNLADATSVSFGSTSASILTKSATSITTTVPSGATTGKISVTTATGVATSTDDFTVTIPAPTLTSFSPAAGAIGAVVTITGTNLSGATAVTFNGTSATITNTTATTVTTTVPAGATTGKIAVTTPGGTIQSENNFIIAVNISNFEEEDADALWGKAEDAGDITVSSISEEGGNHYFELQAIDNNTNHWVGGRYFEVGPDAPFGISDGDLTEVWMTVDVKANAAGTHVGKLVYTVVEDGAPDNRRNYERDFDVTWTDWQTISIRVDKFGYWNGAGMTSAVDGGADIETAWSVALFVKGGNGVDTYDLSFDNLRFNIGAPEGTDTEGHH